MTKHYIGTKIILAWNAEKDGKPGFGVKYADGYTSWSPGEAFEDAYRAIEGKEQALTFGDALHMLKLGKRVARAGWNGKGMWLRLLEPYAPHPEDAPDANPRNPYFRAADNNAEAVGTMLPWIGMKTADNKFVPWLASQTDMLAEDWQVVE